MDEGGLCFLQSFGLSQIPTSLLRRSRDDNMRRLKVGSLYFVGRIKTIGEVHKTAINRVFTHVGVNVNRYLNNPLQTSIHKCTDICAYILSGLNIYTHNLSRIYVQPRKTALTTPKDRTRNPERPHSQPRKTALATPA